MAPKKSRAQASASQPAPANDRPVRAGRKRRLSDASNVSDRPSSSHGGTSATPSKRPRRGKAAAEQEIIVEEEVFDMDRAPSSSAPACDAVGGADATIEVSQKHVHFGAATQGHEDFEEMEKTTASQLTPHPRKTDVKRRTTASPSLGAGAAANADSVVGQRVKRTSTRRSLPAALAEDGDELITYVASHEYGPLREVLRERVQLRVAQHAESQARIRALEVELDGERKKGNTRRVQEIEVEVQELIDEQKAALVELRGVNGLDDNMLVLDTQEEVAYPELPNGTASSRQMIVRASTSLRDSQSSAKDAEWEREREEFRSAIVTLSEEATKAKTDLKVLEIELQGLGLADGVFSAHDVLVTIRESFGRVRESLSAALPNSIPEGASNQDLIEILVANIEEFANRLRLQDRDIYDKDVVVTDLSKQVQGLLDHLAESEIRKQQLQERWNDLDAANETKDRDIQDYQEELDALTKERDDVQDALQVETEKVKVLTEENVEFAANIQRLSTSLRTYQESEKHLQGVILKMEEEHATTVSQMNREREATIREYDGRLLELTKLHEDAEQLAEERHSAIVSLEVRIQEVQAERDSIRGDLEHMTSLRDEEQGARETAEVDLKEKSDEVENLESRVDRLEDQLAELNLELDDLRRRGENERAQREAAEADLQDRDAEVQELDQKVLDLGTQANELRQKLFEVQQSNEQKVNELEQLASERDEQYQADIALEVKRREEADGVGQERAVRIEELEGDIEKVEEEMRTLLAGRDERIEKLESQVATNRVDIETLETDLKSVEDLYEREVESGKQRRGELEDSIANLQATILLHETTIEELRQEAIRVASLHSGQMDDRDTRIAELDASLAAEQVFTNQLREDKLSLEQRVEKEAAEMLGLQAQKDDEIEDLKNTIRDKQAKIEIVEEKAVQADERWQELLTQRDEEISTITTEGEGKTQTLAMLKSEIEAMNVKFHGYVRLASDTISDLQGRIAELHAAAATDGDVVKAQGQELLEQFEASASRAAGLAVVTTATTTTTTTTTKGRHSQQHAAKKTRGRKIKDSGIGAGVVDDDEMLEA